MHIVSMLNWHFAQLISNYTNLPFYSITPMLFLHGQNAPLNCISTFLAYPIKCKSRTLNNLLCLFSYPATWQICVVLWPTLSPRTTTQENQHGLNHIYMMSGVWLQVLYCSGRSQETKAKLCLETWKWAWHYCIIFPTIENEGESTTFISNATPSISIIGSIDGSTSTQFTLF